MLSYLALLVVGRHREGVFGGRKRVKCGQYVPSIPSSLPCVVSCTIPTGHKLNMVPSQQHISTFSSKSVFEAPAGLRANVGALSSYDYRDAAETTSCEACIRCYHAYKPHYWCYFTTCRQTRTFVTDSGPIWTLADARVTASFGYINTSLAAGGELAPALWLICTLTTDTSLI